MNRLVVLCGESPLPVWLSARTLEADDVLIVHGGMNSKTVAQSVATRLADQGVATALFEVSPFNLTEMQTEIEGKLGRLLEGRSLVFGPGTTLMNVLLYGSWLRANVESADRTEGWWTEAGSGRLHSLSGAIRQFDATVLNLAEIARLHDAAVGVTIGHDVLEIVGAFTPADLEQLGDHLNRFLHQRKERQVQFSSRAQGLLASFLTEDHRFKKGGWLLELGTGVFITRYFQDIGHPPDEAVLNLHKRVDNRIIVEFDFVARWREKILCVSCGQGKYEVLRQKLFEIDSRGPKMFGRETKTLTVADAHRDAKRGRGHANGSLYTIWNNRREQLGASWKTRPRDAVVSARELFGDKGGSTFVSPVAVFDNDTMPIAEWLKRSAGLL